MSTARILNFFTDRNEVPAVEVTHESFVHAVRALVVGRLASETERARLMAAKMVYGAGLGLGVRGFCAHASWQNGESHDFIEISAAGEESFVQLAGTTIHELGHCLAGPGAGHGKDWKKACAALGLSAIQAGGQEYAAVHFAPEIWSAIESLPHPSDGKPAFYASGSSAAPALPRKSRRCQAGIGTRGGRSRGVGSGSRMRLYVCGCPEGTIGRKVRVASDVWDATCNACGSKYARAEAPAAK